MGHSLFKKKWANAGLFLFIFVLFKHNIYRKTVDQPDSIEKKASTLTI